MKPEHRRPLIAAVAVLVMCAAMIVHGMRTDALGVITRPMRVIAADVIDPVEPTSDQGVRTAHDAPAIGSTTPRGPSSSSSPSSPSSPDASADAAVPSTGSTSDTTRPPSAPTPTHGADLSGDGAEHQGQGLDADPSSTGDQDGDGDGDGDEGSDGRGRPWGHGQGWTHGDRPTSTGSAQEHATRHLLDAVQDLVTSAGLGDLADLSGLGDLTGLGGLSPASEPARPTR